MSSSPPPSSFPFPPPSPSPLDAENYTFCTYNVLAQALVSREYFPWVKPAALKWNARQKLFEDQIPKINADVFTFQEMDIQKYDIFWKPFLSIIGYETYFSYKAGPTARHGLCTAYKRDKFISFSQHTVQFEPLGHISRESVEKEEITQANLGQIVILLPINALCTEIGLVDDDDDDDEGIEKIEKNIPFLFVLNNHLHWRYYLNYTKMRQILLLRVATTLLQSQMPEYITILDRSKMNKLIQEKKIISNQNVENFEKNNNASILLEKIKCGKLTIEELFPKENLFSSQLHRDLMTFNYGKDVKILPFNSEFNSMSELYEKSEKSEKNDNNEKKNAILKIKTQIISMGDFNLTTSTSCLPFHQNHLWPVILPCYPNQGKLKEMTLSFDYPKAIKPILGPKSLKNYFDQNLTKNGKNNNNIVFDQNKQPIEMNVLVYKSEMYEKEDYLKLSKRTTMVAQNIKKLKHIFRKFNNSSNSNNLNSSHFFPKFFTTSTFNPSQNSSRNGSQNSSRNPSPSTLQDNLIVPSLIPHDSTDHHIHSSYTPQNPYDLVSQEFQFNKMVSFDENNFFEAKITQFNSENNPQQTPISSIPTQFQNSIPSINTQINTCPEDIMPKFDNIYDEIDFLSKRVREKTLFSPYSALFSPLHSLVFLIQLALLHTNFRFLPMSYFPTETEFDSNLFQLIKDQSIENTNTQHSGNEDNILTASKLSLQSSLRSHPSLSPTASVKSNQDAKNDQNNNNVNNPCQNNTQNHQERRYVDKNLEKLAIRFMFSSIGEDTINTFPVYLVESVQHWFSMQFGFIDYQNDADEIKIGKDSLHKNQVPTWPEFIKSQYHQYVERIHGLKNEHWEKVRKFEQDQKVEIEEKGQFREIINIEENDNKSIIFEQKNSQGVEEPEQQVITEPESSQANVETAQKCIPYQKKVENCKKSENNISQNFDENHTKNKKSNNNSEKVPKQRQPRNQPKPKVVEVVQPPVQELDIQVDEYSVDRMYEMNANKLKKFKDLLNWLLEIYDFLFLSMKSINYVEDIPMDDNNNSNNNNNDMNERTNIANSGLILNGGMDLFKSLLLFHNFGQKKPKK